MGERNQQRRRAAAARRGQRLVVRVQLLQCVDGRDDVAVLMKPLLRGPHHRQHVRGNALPAEDRGGR